MINCLLLPFLPLPPPLSLPLLHSPFQRGKSESEWGKMAAPLLHPPSLLSNSNPCLSLLSLSIIKNNHDKNALKKKLAMRITLFSMLLADVVIANVQSGYLHYIMFNLEKDKPDQHTAAHRNCDRSHRPNIVGHILHSVGHFFAQSRIRARRQHRVRHTTRHQMFENMFQQCTEYCTMSPPPTNITSVNLVMGCSKGFFFHYSNTRPGVLTLCK